MDERRKHVHMAKLAEQVERYDDMMDFMKRSARMDVELSAEERNLLSVGYKNVIGARRASWRLLSSLEHKEEGEGSDQQNVKWVREYMNRVEDELTNICNDILSIIAIHLLPASATSDSVVFFYKMKGDYYRYLAEFKTGNERNEAAEQALKAYQTATSTAMTHLLPTHPVRLGLALNFSVLHYEILNSAERACQLAKQAFNEAIAEINSLSEESYKDSILIVRLLKDNLALWTSEEGGEHSKDTNIVVED